MAEVRWHVYCVTFVCVGGYAVIMACCRSWSPSVSVCSPQMHCCRMCFVMNIPLLLASLQLSGSDVIIFLSVLWSTASASISLGISGVIGVACDEGCGCGGCRDD